MAEFNILVTKKDGSVEGIRITDVENIRIEKTHG